SPFGGWGAYPNLIHTPSLRFLVEPDFGLGPNFGKKIRISVVLEGIFIFPVTIRKKLVCIVFIAIKFEELATLKIPDPVFICLKIGQKGFNIFRSKSHFYNSYKHLIKFYGDGIPEF